MATNIKALKLVFNTEKSLILRRVMTRFLMS